MTEERSPSDTERGSRARDHMANERTYLAWLRTAATMMVLGLAEANFVEPGNGRTTTAGGTLMGVGALGIVQGAVRHRRVNGELEDGRFVTGGRWREPVIAGMVLLGAVMAAFVLLLW